MELATISEISREFNISTRTLRYYEQIGLIQSVKKEDYAYRTYDESNIKKLRQILILRKLRISLKHIDLILRSEHSEKIIETFKQNLEEVDEEITALSTIRDIINTFILRLNENTGQKIKLSLLDDSTLLEAVDALTIAKSVLKEEKLTDALNRANEKLGKITDEDVKIVYLPATSAASALGFGDEAEHEADIMMGKFIESTDLFNIYPGLKFYGFNNPEFKPNGEFIRHRYEVWVTIPESLEVLPPLIKKSFSGGLYVSYTSKPVNFGEWASFGEWLIDNDDFEYDRLRSYRPDTAEEHKVRCSGWGCFEEHFNSYNVYKLENKKHILSHMEFLIPVKEKKKN